MVASHIFPQAYGMKHPDLKLSEVMGHQKQINYAGESIILKIANVYLSSERKCRKRNWFLKNTGKNGL